ncbi:MAG: MFS transporter [Oscillospiraceae bacterium]|nr:MFS transporter [Oscillospiraceae bacterium]
MAKKTLKEGWIVPGREKLAAIFGAGSYQAMNTFVTSFLAVYLLMVGISPAIAAAVLLIIRAWDAINDVIFGYLVDKYRFKEGKSSFTKWLFSGRYMPWFRILFLIIPIGTVVMFSINTGWPLWLRVVQYVLGYILFDLGYTASGAYVLLPISMTNNYQERNFILAWNGLGQGIGSLPVVFLGTMFIAGSFGYTGSAVVFSILGLVLALIPALFVKERNVAEYDENAMRNYSIKEMFIALKQVPELFIIFLGALLWGIFYARGYNLFVAYYIFNDANISIVLSLVGIIPSICIIPFLPVIFKHMDKIAVARLVCAIFAICGIIMCILGPGFFVGNLPLFYFLFLIQNTAYVLTMFSLSQLMPDMAEVVKCRSGKDVAGVVSSTYAFVNKLVGSLVTSVSLLILGAYGWVAVEANSFDELAGLNAQGIGLQTERALEGLWNVSFFIPNIGFALAAITFCFVKIKRKNVAIYMRVNSGEITKEEGDELIAKGG